MFKGLIVCDKVSPGHLLDFVNVVSNMVLAVAQSTHVPQCVWVRGLDAIRRVQEVVRPLLFRVRHCHLVCKASIAHDVAVSEGSSRSTAKA